MNKVLIIITFLFLFLSMPSVNNSSGVEKIKVLKFNNFPSKKLDEVFKDLDVKLIEIEIKIDNVVKVYRINLFRYNNIEKEITKRVVKSLKEDNQYELSAISEIKGFKITKIKLRCTDSVENIIYSRIN